MKLSALVTKYTVNLIYTEFILVRLCRKLLENTLKSVPGTKHY